MLKLLVVYTIIYNSEWFYNNLSHLIVLFTFYDEMVYNIEGDILHVNLAIQQLSNVLGLHI